MEHDISPTSYDSTYQPASLSRRDVLRLAGITAISTLVGLATTSCDSEPSSGNNQPLVSQDDPDLNTTPPPETLTKPTNLVEARAELTAIREKLGISNATYWLSNRAPEETLAKIRVSANGDGFLSPNCNVMPIYPAAVMKVASVIEAAAAKHKVPANILAIIATMESAGDPTAQSSMSAQGMFQIVPYYPSGKNLHANEVREILDQPEMSKQQITDALNTPAVAAEVAAVILSEYYAKAVTANPGVHSGSLWLWGHALAAYNGGPSIAGVGFEEPPSQIPIESALYAISGIRFMIDAEVATQLSNDGYSDRTIRWAMASHEIDAEAYAYAEVKETYLGPNSLQNGYEKILAPIIDGSMQRSSHQDNPMIAALTSAYKDYMAGNNQYGIMMPPALRAWVNSGGYNLFKQTLENMNPANYTNPN
ncbi:MAG: transglycosylase SLT domain-containing protein [Candidatus Saccharimonadales bacterium]